MAQRKGKCVNKSAAMGVGLALSAIITLSLVLFVSTVANAALHLDVDRQPLVAGQQSHKMPGNG